MNEVLGMSSGRFRLAAVLLLAGTLLAACSGASAASSPVLKIGAVYPQSGPQAEGGDELQGVRIAAELVNQDGGIHGRQVQIVSRDVPSATDGPAAVDQLVSQGISVIFGTYGSTQALTASAEASKLGATYLETGAVADAVTGRGLPGILRTVATGSTLGRNGARWADSFVIPGFGLTPATARVVVLFEGDQYGSAVGYGSIDEASALGLNVVDTIKYDAGTVNYNQLAARVLADRPDVILTAAYLADAIAFRRAAIAYHIPLKTIVGTSSAYCRQDFGDALGQDAVGLFASDKPDENFRLDGLLPSARVLYQRATAAYHAAYHQPMDAPAIAGFVGGWVMLHEILPHAASLQRKDVWKAAMSVDLPLGSEINGAGVQFAPAAAPDAGQNRRAVSVIWEWLGPGRRAVVYPPVYATAKPQIIQAVT